MTDLESLICSLATPDRTASDVAEMANCNVCSVYHCIDKYKLNALDESRCCYVGQAISEYEETSGIEIRKIAFYTDAESAIPTYPHLYSHTGDLICSSFNQSWSDLSALNYYLGTNYEKVDPVENTTFIFLKKTGIIYRKDS